MSFNKRPSITYTAISNISVTVTGNQQPGTKPLTLDNVTSHVAWLTDKDGSIRPFHQSVYASNGIIVFTVQRRTQKFDLEFNALLLAQLPHGLGVLGNDSMNDTAIHFPDTITLTGGLRYDIRSALALTETEVETIEGNRRQITGCNAYICSERGYGALMDPVGSKTDECYRYDPYMASRPLKSNSGGYYRDRPFSKVNRLLDVQLGEEGIVEAFHTAASKRGVVFIYGLSAESKILGSRNQVITV